MEEKKRSIFYAKGMKILFVVLFLAAVGGFSAAVMTLADFMSREMEPEYLGNEAPEAYGETTLAGDEVEAYVKDQIGTAKAGAPFCTDGKLDPKKTVDITNLKAKKKEKNEYTTYTVADLENLIQNDVIFTLQSHVEEADYYGEGYSDDEDEYYTTETLKEKAEELGVDVSDWDDSRKYSQAFCYLYIESIGLEKRLPLSGIPLAEYARQNPDSVSLRDLYEQLVEAAGQLERYKRNRTPGKSNVMYRVENLDTGKIYTNVKAWEKGLTRDARSVYSLDLFYQAEREDGILETISKPGTDAEKFLDNYLQESTLSGENESVVIALDTSYPVADHFSERAQQYTNFRYWGKILIGIAIGSFVLGILLMILMMIQAGRVRTDRELHLYRGDRIPTEVILGVFVVALGIMCGIGMEGVDYLSTGTQDIFAALACMFFEIALAGLVLACWFSLTRCFKGRTLWKSSLCYTIAESGRRVYAARQTSGRMIISFLVLVLGNMFLAAVFGGFGFFIDLIIDGLVLLYLIREQAGRQVIRDGLGRIAGGELDFKIQLDGLNGDNREMAEAVNHVGDGLQEAVKETLKSERLKADLITNVSHDIKTPLTSIINYVDLLKREEIGDPKARGYIDVLDAKSQRLKQLTEDLVEASKISSGNVVLDMQPIQFGELIRQTNGEFEEKFAARNLQLISDIPEENFTILADGRRLWRVAENLYNNAAKYAMPGTRVYVEMKKTDGKVVFEIKNMSENPLNIQAEELTERFIRGDVSRSTEGSGLGLSIAKNLVVLQNGTFEVYLDGDLFKVTISFEAQ